MYTYIYIYIHIHILGHALIALKTDGADPIHKATIMPRGRALGTLYITLTS
jgi:ATP-dependent Zn protease